MGEATYYMKARFETEEQAAAAAPKLKAFIDEGLKAEDWWQSHRDWQRKPELGPVKFFEEFEKQFPQIHRYLGEYAGVDFTDCNNKLAGILSFGDEETEPEVEGTTIKFSGLVWHFADWDFYAQWIRKELGAQATGWVSDEDSDVFDSIDV